jgi:hypothetical protein
MIRWEHGLSGVFGKCEGSGSSSEWCWWETMIGNELGHVLFEGERAWISHPLVEVRVRDRTSPKSWRREVS